MATQVLMSDTCPLVVKILNDDSAEAAKPLFIVHHSALGASDHSETEKAYGFLTDTFRVLVFDARGCGGSGKLGRWELSHARLVEDLEELRLVF
jgi:proline iminopeptidase